MHVYICSDLTIIMSYKYEVNFEIDIIRGEAKEMNSDNAIEQKMCHKFVIGEKIDDPGEGTQKPPRPSNCRYTLQHEGNVEEEWLYGPITNRDHQVIYPCSRFRCSIPCPCYLCQGKEHSNLSKYDKLMDHTYYHKTHHHYCFFCDNILQCLPNFNYWFLNKNIRLINGTREHFKIKHPSVNPSPKPCQMMDEHTHPMDPVNLSQKIYYSDYETYITEFKQLMYHDKIICEECNYIVETIDQYREHIDLNHTISKRFFHAYHNSDFRKLHEPFRCFQCDKIFLSRSKLSRHAQKVHYEVLFKCGRCQEKFTFKDNLDRHWKTIHKGYKESCYKCGKKFSRIDHVIEHGENIHQVSRYSCDDCGSNFSSNWNLLRHKKLATNEDGNHKFKCKECSKVLCSHNMLKRHMNEEHVNFTCDTCGKNFSLKRNYTRHMKVHDDKPKEMFTCDTCGIKFSVKYNYTTHIKIHDDEPKEVFTCDTCGIKFFAKNNYARHLKSHADDTKEEFTCDTCGMQFKAKWNYERHLKRQQNISCSVCDAKFCTFSSFTQHRKIYHTKEAERKLKYNSK